MYGKITEFLVKRIYHKRFAQADEIALAAELANKGNPKGALEILDPLSPNIHSSLRGVFGLTHSRILASEGRLHDAEKSLIAAARAEPSNARIHLDLAVISGRRFRFESARERLELLAAEADQETQKEAREIIELLDSIVSGKRLIEFEDRAHAMSQKAIGPNGESPGLPANIPTIDDWIDRCPGEAVDFADDIAILVGESETRQGATWKISLAIEDSVVLKDGKGQINPFRCVAKRLSSPKTNLSSLIQNGWT